jgi:hypothetical protein
MLGVATPLWDNTRCTQRPVRDATAVDVPGSVNFDPKLSAARKTWRDRLKRLGSVGGSDLGNEDAGMPKEQSPGKPTTRR